MTEPRDARLANGAPAPGAEVQRLGALVGRWRTEGRIVAAQPVPITGTDAHEWLPGGFFLLQEPLSGAARC